MERVSPSNRDLIEIDLNREILFLFYIIRLLLLFLF